MNPDFQRAQQKKVIIATRNSALAMWQAHTVKSLFEHAGMTPELLPTVTSGDKLQKGALADHFVEKLESLGQQLKHLQTGKGLFVKEIQESMLAGSADVAVHSMKDLPVARTPGMSVVGILPRAAYKDVLILSPQVIKEFYSIFPAEQGPLAQVTFETARTTLLKCPSFLNGTVGTTSARRQMQMRAAFLPNLRLEVLRGNVDTRLARVRNNEFAAILLANAGLERLQLFNTQFMLALPLEYFIPAPAQGIIAIETIDTRSDVVQFLGTCSHLPTLLAAALERHVLDLLGGDCHTAIAVHFQDAKIAIECGRDKKCVKAIYALSHNQLSFLIAELESCGGNYSTFLATLESSEISSSLHTFLRERNFDLVSHLKI